MATAGSINTPLEVQELVLRVRQEYGMPPLDEQKLQQWMIVSCIESGAGANIGDTDQACKGLFQVNDKLNFPTDPGNQNSILYKLRHNEFSYLGVSAEDQIKAADKIEAAIKGNNFALDNEANALAAMYLEADDSRAMGNVKEQDPLIRQYAAHLTGSGVSKAILNSDDSANLKDVILAANNGDRELTDNIINGNARLLKSYFHPNTNSKDESAFEIKTVGDFKRALKADEAYFGAAILKETTLFHPSQEAMGSVLGDIKEHDADTAKKIEDKIKAGEYADAFKDLNAYYEKVFKEAGLEDKRKDSAALIMTNSFGPHDTIAMLKAEKEGKGDSTLIKDITSKETFDIFAKRARNLGVEIPEDIDFEKITVTQLRNLSQEMLKGEQTKVMGSIHDGTAAKGGPGGGEAEKDGNGWLDMAVNLLPKLFEGGLGGIMLAIIAFCCGMLMNQGNGEKKAEELGAGGPGATQQMQVDPFANINQMTAAVNDPGVATLISRTELLIGLAGQSEDTKKAVDNWLRNGQTDDATIQKIMAEAKVPADQQKLLLGLNGQQKEAISDTSLALSKMVTANGELRGVVQYQDSSGKHIVDLSKMDANATEPTTANDAALAQFAALMKGINTAKTAQDVVITEVAAQTVPNGTPPAAQASQLGAPPQQATPAR